MLRQNSFEVYLRGHVFGRLYSDGGVPLSRGQHRHLVQELVNARHQVIAVFGFVRDVVENLSARQQKRGIMHRLTIVHSFSFVAFESDLGTTSWKERINH